MFPYVSKQLDLISTIFFNFIFLLFSPQTMRRFSTCGGRQEAEAWTVATWACLDPVWCCPLYPCYFERGDDAGSQITIALFTFAHSDLQDVFRCIDPVWPWHGRLSSNYSFLHFSLLRFRMGWCLPVNLIIIVIIDNIFMAPFSGIHKLAALYLT